MKDTEEVVLASNSSWFPVGESFLAAQGIRLTREELALPPGSPSRETFWERFLSGSDYALRLAAQSSECPARFLSVSGEAGAGIEALQGLAASVSPGAGFLRRQRQWLCGTRALGCAQLPKGSQTLQQSRPQPPCGPTLLLKCAGLQPSAHAPPSGFQSVPPRGSGEEPSSLKQSWFRAPSICELIESCW